MEQKNAKILAKEKNFTLQPHKPLYDKPVVAFIISVIAILISIGGLGFTYLAYNLSIIEHRQTRSLILKGTFDESGTTAHIAPVSDSNYFMHGQVIYPTLIYNEINLVKSSGKLWHLDKIQQKLIELTTGMKTEQGDIQSFSFGVPIIIISYYASNGMTYTDKSLYTLDATAYLESKQGATPNVLMTSITFIRHDSDIDQSYIDKINKGTKIVIPYQKL